MGNPIQRRWIMHCRMEPPQLIFGGLFTGQASEPSYPKGMVKSGTLCCASVSKTSSLVLQNQSKCFHSATLAASSSHAGAIKMHMGTTLSRRWLGKSSGLGPQFQGALGTYGHLLTTSVRLLFPPSSTWLGPHRLPYEDLANGSYEPAE